MTGFPVASTIEWFAEEIELCKALKSGPSVNSVQFSHSVVSDSLQPHGLQHVRLSCPSPTPGADKTWSTGEGKEWQTPSVFLP